MESQIKRLKPNDDYFEIEYFQNQYKCILLLLHFGIYNLPFELVLMILKDYVYIPPIRISQWCMESCPCQHTIEGRKKAMDMWEIKQWFEKNKIVAPDHFQHLISICSYDFPSELDEL